MVPPSRPQQGGLDCRILTSDESRRLTRKPQYDISETLWRKAVANGDTCFAILDGGAIACYGWYACRPPVLLNIYWDAWFGPDCVYMHSALTLPSYRGQHLHPYALSVAARHYAGRGIKYMVAAVESVNYASLKAFYRMGYKTCGTARVLKLGDRNFIRHSRGCQQFAFRISPASESYGVTPTIHEPSIAS